MTVEQRPQLRVDTGWGRELDLKETLQPTLGNYFSPGSALGIGIAAKVGVEIKGYGSSPLLEAAHSAIWPTLLEIPPKVDTFDREHDLERNGVRVWVLNHALRGNLVAPETWTSNFVGEDGISPELGEGLLALAYLSHAAILLNHAETNNRLPVHVKDVLEETALSDVQNAVEHLSKVPEVMDRVSSAIEGAKTQVSGLILNLVLPKK